MAATIDIPVAGVDLMVPDVTGDDDAVIEVNAPAAPTALSTTSHAGRDRPVPAR